MAEVVWQDFSPRNYRRQCAYAGLGGDPPTIIPGPWGTVDQEAIGRAFVGELERNEGSGTKILHNADMRRY